MITLAVCVCVCGWRNNLLLGRRGVSSTFSGGWGSLCKDGEEFETGMQLSVVYKNVFDESICRILVRMGYFSLLFMFPVKHSVGFLFRPIAFFKVVNFIG